MFELLSIWGVFMEVFTLRVGRLFSNFPMKFPVQAARSVAWQLI
jgi:hypothetical protein